MPHKSIEMESSSRIKFLTYQEYVDFDQSFDEYESDDCNESEIKLLDMLNKGRVFTSEEVHGLPDIVRYFAIIYHEQFPDDVVCEYLCLHTAPAYIYHAFELRLRFSEFAFHNIEDHVWRTLVEHLQTNEDSELLTYLINNCITQHLEDLIEAGDWIYEFMEIVIENYNSVSDLPNMKYVKLGGEFSEMAPDLYETYGETVFDFINYESFDIHQGTEAMFDSDFIQDMFDYLDNRGELERIKGKFTPGQLLIISNMVEIPNLDKLIGDMDIDDDDDSASTE
jgi:hypothetical protein